MKIKRKDKTIKPRYQQLEEDLEENGDFGGLSKRLLLLVEGETEEAYFEKLKQNPWVTNRLAGVKIERLLDLKIAFERANGEDAKANQIWLVCDNDKRNAFVLEQNGQPFFKQLSDIHLPFGIRSRLQVAYDSNKHNYFFSIHDYLQWLCQAISIEDVVEYWDRIQYFTPEKKREFEKFFKPDEESGIQLNLAYSCLAFEFWLILHFERINTPFLWVDKGKPKAIDVAAYLCTIKPGYEKGYFDQQTKKEKPCHAYNCLYQNKNKYPQTKDDEWQVLMRIFTAIQNAEWLRLQMQSTLERQSGKWWEVNPYIKGMDDLMKELLNIKPLGQSIEYFGLSVQFSFDIKKSLLIFRAVTNDEKRFVVGIAQESCFEIKNGSGQTFLPLFSKNTYLPNDNTPINLQYDFSQSSDDQLVLIFNDPRSSGKSNQLFVFLT